MSRLINILNKVYKQLILFLKTPRLTIILFQVRIIERYLKIDLFFLSPRRLIIFFIEKTLLKNINSTKLKHYGNYKLDATRIAKNSIIYSGGVGRNIEFDLSVSKRHKCKIRLFDPTKNSIDYIKGIKLGKNIFFYPFALFNKNQKVKLYQDPSNRVKSASINNFFSFKKNSYFWAQAYNVPTLKKKFKDKNIDILKLDIEGVAEEVIVDCFKKKIYPMQIVSAFEVPLNYVKFFIFTKRILNFIKILKKNYHLYNLRDRSRGIEMEILAIKYK